MPSFLAECDGGKLQFLRTNVRPPASPTRSPSPITTAGFCLSNWRSAFVAGPRLRSSAPDRWAVLLDAGVGEMVLGSSDLSPEWSHGSRSTSDALFESGALPVSGESVGFVFMISRLHSSCLIIRGSLETQSTLSGVEFESACLVHSERLSTPCNLSNAPTKALAISPIKNPPRMSIGQCAPFTMRAKAMTPVATMPLPFAEG